MNDDTLMTAVREPFTAVHMDTPVEQIVRRGRAVRVRRRIFGLAGAAAVAAGATVAVTALLPAGHPAGPQLAAAWTVTGQANGTIDVTIDVTICAMRPGYRARFARMACRPASPSAASRTRRAGSTPASGI